MARKSIKQPGAESIPHLPTIWIPVLSQGQASYPFMPIHQNKEAVPTYPLMAESSVLEGFADMLVYFFKDGLAIDNSIGGQWFATLDSLNIDDNQVNAMTRISPTRPTQPRLPELRANIYEDRKRKPFAKKKNGVTGASDLLLSYSFMLAFSIMDNIRLYQEFARNELDRLRGKPANAETK